MMITRSMIGLAALIATGIVAADDVSGTQLRPVAAPAQITPVAPSQVDFTGLRNDATSALKALKDREQATDDANAKCRNQAWPYYTSDCLAPVQGRPVAPQPTRFVGAERTMS